MNGATSPYLSSLRGATVEGQPLHAEEIGRRKRTTRTADRLFPLSLAMFITSGSILDGRYELGERLGSGGFGEVFAATHTVTKGRYALKLLSARPGTTARKERLLREAHLAAALVDDHITQVFDAGMHQEIPFVVMEFLDGEDLGQRLEREGSFPADEACLFLLHVALGLSVAHEQNIVHLDLKPRNMFLIQEADGRPRVKLLDFGTARLLRHSAEDSSTLLAGTPVYMAPEQFKDAVIGRAADIYAFGMSAFHMLAGHAFYALEQQQTTNPFALGARLMHGVPESASSRAARYGTVVPDGFDTWFARCIHTDPDQRYPSALEAHQELIDRLALTRQSLAEVQVVPAPPAGPRAAPTPSFTASLHAHEDTDPTSTPRLEAAPPSPPPSNRSKFDLAILAAATAAIGVATSVSPELATLSLGLVSPPSIAQLSRDPAIAIANDDCRASYRWSSIKARVFHPEAEDGFCDGFPLSPLVVIIHDHDPSEPVRHESYHYLQRHLARNGFATVSIDVGALNPRDASAKALFFMETFLALFWPEVASADADSVSLIGHGRGASTVRLLADELVGHPYYAVRTIVTMGAHGQGFELGVRHAKAHLELVTSTSPTSSSKEELQPTRKVIAGADRGFAGGSDAQNRVVQGYVLAFLAAHHQGDDRWYDHYVAGDRVPGVTSLARE